MVDSGYLDTDGGMLFIGPEAEKRLGRRHFMSMTAVFTGPPELTVLYRRSELGRIDPSLLTDEVRGDDRLHRVRDERSSLVHPGGNVILVTAPATCAGGPGCRANATRAATLSEVVDPVQRFDDRQIRLRADLAPGCPPGRSGRRVGRASPGHPVRVDAGVTASRWGRPGSIGRFVRRPYATTAGWRRCCTNTA